MLCPDSKFCAAKNCIPCLGAVGAVALGNASMGSVSHVQGVVALANVGS